MIRVRLLGVAVLLAGMACSATSTAPDTASQQEPDEVATEQPAPGQGQVDQESAAAGPLAEAATAVAMGTSEDPASAAQSTASFQELVGQVRGRIDGFVPGALQTLDEVKASFDAARAHAKTVFARLASLRAALDEADFSGVSLDRLEQEAAGLNETAEFLQEDLLSQQTALRNLVLGLADIEAQVAALEDEAAAADPQALPRAELRDLDADAAAFQESGAVQDLVSRSDKLVSRVAVLVSHVDRTERSVEAAIQPPGETEGTAAASGSGLGGATLAAAGGAVSGSAPATAIVEEDDTLTPKGEIAEITTNQGTLLLQLFPDVAPAHVQNFKRLVRDGFYDGLTFHRVLSNYIIQGGCPSGDGFGGPGWQVDNEFNRRHHRRGTVSMARFAHPDSAGSQFFICLDDRPELDGKQTVFGRVIRGEDTLEAIEALADPDGNGTPTEPIIIQQINLRPWRQGDNETSMIAGNPVR